MTHLVLVLATWYLSAEWNAQDLKRPARELEGVWQEPAHTGESPGLRFRITFTGDKVSIVIGKQDVHGTWRVEARERVSCLIVSVVDTADRSGATRTDYLACYAVIGGDLFLLIDPVPLSATHQFDDDRRSASLLLRLERVKE